MTWRAIGLTHIGKVRQINQDAFRLCDDLGLWIIADGMGGHAGGEIASQLAVDRIAGFFQEQLAPRPRSRNGSRRNAGVLLRESMEAANQTIRDHAHDHVEYAGMGTTAVALHISDTAPYVGTIAHVGDSRAYLVRDQTLSPLTRDHSLVEERIELGIITPEQALTHPLRHILTQALGIEQSVLPSITTIELTDGDHLLLCTDGLTKMLTDQEILKAILDTNKSLDRVGRALIEEANHQGGEDNVTVVMIGMEE